MKKFFSNMVKWSPLFLLYYLFDASGNELGNAVAKNLKAKYNFAKAKAGYYAGRVGIITLLLWTVGFWAYAKQWYVLSVFCDFILSAGYMVSLIIVKGLIPKDKKDSWGGVVNVFLYIGFLVLVVLPLAKATILMPWNDLSVGLVFSMWVLAIAAYATIVGGPVSPFPLKLIMVAIGIMGFVYTLFLSNGAVGYSLERARVTFQMRIANRIASWSKEADDGPSPYDQVLYLVPKGTPVYTLRVAFGKVISAELDSVTAVDRVVALATNAPFVKGLQELRIVQFPDKKTGQYTGGKESWKGIARKDLISLVSLQKDRADSTNKALAAKQAAAATARQDSLDKVPRFVPIALRTKAGDRLIFNNKGGKNFSAVRVSASGAEVDAYVLSPTMPPVINKLASGPEAVSFDFRSLDGQGIVVTADTIGGVKKFVIL